MAVYLDCDEFNLEGMIGQGAFGKVYLISSKSSTDKKYAFKVIDLSKATKTDREAAEREAEVLSKIQHENVIRHIDSFEKRGALCIMTEYCDKGNLLGYLEERGKKKLEEARIATWLKQIASGLEYMHSNLLMHRDMKTENVFLCGEELTAKLGDLGLVKVLERPTALAMTFCGSPYYMSPDIFSNKPYGQKTDIWALGVIVYELATLDRPFDATGMLGLVNKIVSGQLPEMPKRDYCPELISLMERMLSRNPETRPSATEVLNDPFLKPRRPLPEPPKEIHQKAKKEEEFLMSVRGRPQAVKATFELDHQFNFDVRNLVDSLTLVRRHRTMKQDADKTLKHDKPNAADKYKYKSTKGIPDADVSMADIFANFDDKNMTLKESVRHMPTPTSSIQLFQRAVNTLIDRFPQGDDKVSERGQRREEQDESDGWTQLADLQGHCVKVLGENLFGQAYDILGSSDNQDVIEKKYRTLLSPDQYDSVASHLFFCKTLETSLTIRG